MTILFAGGGTGGHIFPNLAIVERLRAMDVAFEPHFLVSTRTLDAKLMSKHQLTYTVLPARPLDKRPWTWWGFYSGWQRSVSRVMNLIRDRRVAAVVATGGFVSGPAIYAPRKMRSRGASGKLAGVPGVPGVALVNLDAVPGKANRWMAGHATTLFSAYPVADWPTAQVVSVPLRLSAIGSCSPPEARAALGLLAERPTLLVSGGSQGAESINRMMEALVALPEVAASFRGWQILHLAGEREVANLKLAYERAGIPSLVLPFCDTMGLAWASADLAISRAGANSVAEAQVNACPTIFLPYPYHADEHQRHNAQPLADTGCALIVRDLIDPRSNAQQLTPMLLELLRDQSRRDVARQRMRRNPPIDGASAVARWLAEIIRVSG